MLRKYSSVYSTCSAVVDDFFDCRQFQYFYSFSMSIPEFNAPFLMDAQFDWKPVRIFCSFLTIALSFYDILSMIVEK